MCIIISIFKGYSVFVHSDVTGGKYGNFDYKNFITGYIGIPLYLALIFGYKFWYKTEGVKPATADLYSKKDEIDIEEKEFIAVEQARKAEKGRAGGWYKLISWLF